MRFVILSGFIFISFFYQSLLAQPKMEADLDHAFQNAKKGIYWALANIPERKAKEEKDLIADDKLISEVKLYKEENGVKVIATGYYNTTSITVVTYRSNDSLLNDGYLNKITDVEEEE